MTLRLMIGRCSTPGLCAAADPSRRHHPLKKAAYYAANSDIDFQDPQHVPFAFAL